MNEELISIHLGQGGNEELISVLLDQGVNGETGLYSLSPGSKWRH